MVASTGGSGWRAMRRSLMYRWNIFSARCFSKVSKGAGGRFESCGASSCGVRSTGGSVMARVKFSQLDPPVDLNAEIKSCLRARKYFYFLFYLDLDTVFHDRNFVHVVAV